MKKEGDVVCYPFQSLGHLLAEKYFISKMGVVVLRSICPNNEGSSLIRVIVFGVDVLREYLSLGLFGNRV